MSGLDCILPSVRALLACLPAPPTKPPASAVSSLSAMASPMVVGASLIDPLTGVVPSPGHRGRSASSSPSRRKGERGELSSSQVVVQTPRTSRSPLAAPYSSPTQPSTMKLTAVSPGSHDIASEASRAGAARSPQATASPASLLLPSAPLPRPHAASATPPPDVDAPATGVAYVHEVRRGRLAPKQAPRKPAPKPVPVANIWGTAAAATAGKTLDGIVTAAAVAATVLSAPETRENAGALAQLSTPQGSESRRPGYKLPLNRCAGVSATELASQSSLPLPRCCVASATPRSVTPQDSVGGIGSHSQDVQQARQREALRKLLASSAQNLRKFEQNLSALRRGAAESLTRYSAFEAQLARARSAGGLMHAQLEHALTVSSHTTADMEAALELAESAFEWHRAAHDTLASRDGHGDDLTASPPSRLPVHPAEPGNILQETTTLRQAQAHCRKVMRASDETFAAARAQMANAAARVQTAIADSRKQAKISLERERARGPVKRELITGPPARSREGLYYHMLPTK